MIKQHTILVVDDETEISKMMLRFLKINGFEAQAAATLKEGENLIQNMQPEWLFLDINLPDGNGLDAMANLKRQSTSTKIIVMSAISSPENKTMALKNGAVAFIAKPFSLSTIKQILQST